MRADIASLPERVGTLDRYIDAVIRHGKPVVTHHAVKRVCLVLSFSLFLCVSLVLSVCISCPVLSSLSHTSR